MHPTPPATALRTRAANGSAHARYRDRRSSLGKISRNLLSRNRAFADDAPPRSFIGEVNDGGRNIARRSATIDNNADAALELVAHLLRAGALRSSAQVRRRSGNGNSRCRYHSPRNLRVRHAQSHVASVSSYLERKARSCFYDNG